LYVIANSITIFALWKSQKYKIQNSKKIPYSKTKTTYSGVIGVWYFGFSWDLGFEHWDLR
jgi:hypothetical protein